MMTSFQLCHKDLLVSMVLFVDILSIFEKWCKNGVIKNLLFDFLIFWIVLVLQQWRLWIQYNITCTGQFKEVVRHIPEKIVMLFNVSRILWTVFRVSPRNCFVRTLKMLDLKYDDEGTGHVFHIAPRKTIALYHITPRKTLYVYHIAPRKTPARLPHCATQDFCKHV